MEAIRRGCRGNVGKTQGGLPLGNPVCLWQTELFKLNLKSSPSSSGYNRRRRLATRSSGKQQAGRTAVRTAPIVCPKESPLLASISDNFVAGNTPLVGPDAPTPAREKGLQPYGALDCFEWRSEGGAGGRAESPQCARRRNPLPPAGSDAPTPARGEGLQPSWGYLFTSEAIRRGAGGERKATLLA